MHKRLRHATYTVMYYKVNSLPHVYGLTEGLMMLFRIFTQGKVTYCTGVEFVETMIPLCENIIAHLYSEMPL